MILFKFFFYPQGIFTPESQNQGFIQLALVSHCDLGRALKTSVLYLTLIGL